MVIYVPGTEETDPKKQNMSLQAIAAAATTAIANIATNTTNIATNTTNIATNTSGLASLVAGPLTSGNVAVKSDQTTATSITLAVTPGRQQFHPSAAKAWAYVTNNGTATLVSGYNITSVSRTGTGTTVLTFTTAFSAANYATIGSGAGAGNTVNGVSPPTSASTQTITTRTGANVTTDLDYNVVFFGTQ